MPAQVEELWSEKDAATAALLPALARIGDLAGALFRIAGTPSAEADAGRAQLAAWGARLGSLAPPEPRGQAQALAALLGGELGFAGDEAEYHHPRNSDLHEVLARRRGLPILLAAVWIEVGRRAGLSVDGIGLPGHFVVRVGGPAGVHADPFAGGRLLGLDDVRRIGARFAGNQPFREEWLQPAPVPAILARVLRNLQASHGTRGERVAQLRSTWLLSALQPDDPHLVLQRGRLCEALGAREHALDAYAELRRRWPGTRLAAQAAAQEQNLASPALLN